MWANIKGYWTWAVDRFFHWFGRYRVEHVNNVAILLAGQVDDLQNEVNGLTYSIGEMERRNQDAVLIIVGLLMLNGEDEKIIKADFLREIYDTKIILDATNNDAGDVVLKVLTNNQTEESGV